MERNKQQQTNFGAFEPTFNNVTTNQLLNQFSNLDLNNQNSQF